MLAQIADAVALLHAAGWSHGDLRPDNVLLEDCTQQAFLLDLGEALPVEDPHTGTGSTSLTDTPACDLRQLGALLAWSLTGVDPAVDPERLSRSAGFHPIAVQLWHESRSGRLACAGTFRDQLRRLARQLGIRG
jgi:serine/threonine protein kinase